MRGHLFETISIYNVLIFNHIYYAVVLKVGWFPTNNLVTPNLSWPVTISIPSWIWIYQNCRANQLSWIILELDRFNHQGPDKKRETAISELIKKVIGFLKNKCSFVMNQNLWGHPRSGLVYLSWILCVLSWGYILNIYR